MKKRKDNTRAILKKIYKLRRLPDSDVDILHYFYDDKYINKLWYYLEKDFKGKDLRDYKRCEQILEDLIFSFYLTKNFVRKYADILNWNFVCAWQKFDGDFLMEFKDKVKWETALEEQIFSEEWIRKNADWFEHEHWYHLSDNKKLKLSESFLREYKDQLEWCFLSYRYDFTPEFVREVSDKIYYNHFRCSKKKYIKDEKEFTYNDDKFDHDKLIHLNEMMSND